jgi:prepilin-type N-terminal cleavage/methylation domain-containing protein
LRGSLVAKAARWRRPSGFTLVELLVVIGIIVLLLAISVPIATRLTAGNRAMSCESHLHKIHQAIRMYRLDEGSFPPYVYDPNTNQVVGRGLLALLDTGHLTARSTLRCPLDDRDYTAEILTYAAPGFGYDADDPLSYQWIDPDGAVAGATPAFKYLTSRNIPDTDPDYDRVPAHSRGPTYQPDDTTVLTWCQFHQKVLTEGGRAQCMALFYDGRVDRLDVDLLYSGDTGTSPPEECWRVRPGQTGWSGGAPVY